MNYSALYRKYRPQVFSDVIGQSHITETLKNQIKSGRISHAYLFTGSRGTGKTTCAKIFARAVNCAEPNDGSPCGKCDVCVSLADSSNIDIMEIDAASNNKVDEIREIREKVKFLPVKGKYKVYIIDEVHMLTDSAFNALLKTLEEPPAHVIFILATTEVHKLPATILSRCQRFDFRLVSVDELTAHLKNVYDKEGRKYEEEAVAYIARAAEGSVRDCLSIADMCLNYAGEKLTYNDVLSVLGAADKGKIRELFAKIAGGDIGGIFKSIDELASSGKAMSLIAKELTKYARDLLVIKTADESLLTDTKENIARMKEEIGNYSAELLISVIRIFSEIDAELRYSVSPRIVLETAAVRASRLQTDDFTALAERVRRLEQDGVKVVAAAQSVGGQGAQTAVGAAAEKPADAKFVSGRLTTCFRENGNMGLYTLVGGHHDYGIVGDNFIIYAIDEEFLRFSEPSVIDEINSALKKMNIALKTKVEKRTDVVDMDKEINNIKKLIGNAKLNINK